jgi:hypothetical protein
MITGCSEAADSNIARNKPIKPNIVPPFLSGELHASPKAVRLRSGTRRNAGALPARLALFAMLEVFPVSSNARAHACTSIDSRIAIQAHFVTGLSVRVDTSPPNATCIHPLCRGHQISCSRAVSAGSIHYSQPHHVPAIEAHLAALLPVPQHFQPICVDYLRQLIGCGPISSALL